MRNIWGPALVWAAVMGGIWAFVEMTSKSLSPAGRRVLSAILSTGYLAIPATVAKAPHYVSLLFDAAFGAEHLTLRCFWRCAFASVVVLCVWLPWHVLSMILEASAELEDESFGFALFVISMAVVATITANVLPDYLSLWKTRLLLRQMPKRQSFNTAVLLIMCDVTLTVMITIVFSVLSAVLMSRVFYNHRLNVDEFVWFLLRPWLDQELFLDGNRIAVIALRPFVYTTFWPILFTAFVVASAVIARPMKAIVDQLTFVRIAFDFDQHPVEVLGVTLAIAITTTMVILLVLGGQL
jgi:hypothetical protein